ncbi:NADH-dependent fumarate reductase-like protein [Leishmania tarentolae]|uniref:NADH-dependent fumarate reductase-like protein n=1 Tax=Leishmania tarentolae TaxID=5689 RepID=A0A640KF22_LEITA|nr:NADH-dependent fumarate reductase-like protein [Leishmania tarentolae]
MARLPGPSLNWLLQYFDCHRSKLSFMGGHSRPRTHRGRERSPSIAIT